jgi:hypothetical protein
MLSIVSARHPPSRLVDEPHLWDFPGLLGRFETAALRSQIATSNIGRGGRRYPDIFMFRLRSVEAKL